MNKYYEQINKALLSHEEHKSWHDKSMDWICDRIAWCWKWKKLSEKELIELTDRVNKVFKGE